MRPIQQGPEASVGPSLSPSGKLVWGIRLQHDRPLRDATVIGPGGAIGQGLALEDGDIFRGTVELLPEEAEAFKAVA